MPVPSDEWIRLQFFSACLLSHTALRYTGHLEVQHWVQQRQWRKEHEDAHYAACLFATRMSMLFWWEVTQTLLVLMTNIEWKLVNLTLQWLLRNEDDKLLSSLGCSYKQLTTILQNLVSYLWWFCCVTYQMKLEAHGNIGDIIKERRSIWTVLTTNNHRVMYISVKLALIVLFRKLDLDYLCAVRTAPYHSYRNAVERITSILNLGLQAVATARKSMLADMKAEISKCNKSTSSCSWKEQRFLWSITRFNFSC